MAAVSPISNWVKLTPGVPTRLHFTDHAIKPVPITDPITKYTKTVESLQMQVDKQDGSPVSKTFSVLSERLAGELGPYLPDKRYTRFEFVIVKDGPGPTPPRIAQAIPL
jgi:hypothetical protein